MAKKFIGYFRLIENCDRAGCPVCRSLGEDTRRYLDALLYEQVTDPDTRRALRASLGFCNWHTWMLLEIEHGVSGAAIIYEDLLRTVVDRTRRLERPVGRAASRLKRLVGRSPRSLIELYHRRTVCPACVNAAESEARYLETMVTFVDEPDLKVAYGRSSGLCVPHAFRAVELAGASPASCALLDRTLAKWADVRTELESFIRKHDYRNTEPYTESEAVSYRRAFETLSGAAGVFGNEMHVSM